LCKRRGEEAKEKEENEIERGGDKKIGTEEKERK